MRLSGILDRWESVGWLINSVNVIVIVVVYCHGSSVRVKPVMAPNSRFIIEGFQDQSGWHPLEPQNS